MNKNKGFTLMELIVCIAILAALSAIALPNASAYVEKGRKEACYTNNDTVKSTFQALMTNDAAIVDYSKADPSTDDASALNAKILDNFKQAVSEAGCDPNTATWGGTTGFSFTAKCGNKARVDISTDGRMITKITCSKHGARD